jgi:hypothetical protein
MEMWALYRTLLTMCGKNESSAHLASRGLQGRKLPVPDVNFKIYELVYILRELRLVEALSVRPAATFHQIFKERRKKGWVGMIEIEI